MDTSAYSWFRRGHQATLEHIAAAEVVGVPVTVIGELEAGFLRGSRYRDNRVALDTFLEEAFVETLDVSRAVAERYGKLHAALRRAGTPIPVNDVWIAATAIVWGGRLLTFDTDFASVPDLELLSVI